MNTIQVEGKMYPVIDMSTHPTNGLMLVAFAKGVAVVRQDALGTNYVDVVIPYQVPNPRDIRVHVNAALSNGYFSADLTYTHVGTPCTFNLIIPAMGGTDDETHIR